MFSNYEESKPSCYMRSYQRGAMVYSNRQAQAIALVMPQSHRHARTLIATPSFSFALSSLISLLIISLVIVRLVLMLLGL